MKEKTSWQDYLGEAQILVENNYTNLTDVEVAKKLFLINKGREEEAATSSSPKHNN